MYRIRTHYDNLKVSRNAPDEVIRVAYRVLSKKFHPDLNPNNAEAERLIRIINDSYEVLIDPDKKEEYDEWIAKKESICIDDNLQSKKGNGIEEGVFNKNGGSSS